MNIALTKVMNPSAMNDYPNYLER